MQEGLAANQPHDAVVTGGVFDQRVDGRLEFGLPQEEGRAVGAAELRAVGALEHAGRSELDLNRVHLGGACICSGVKLLGQVDSRNRGVR